MTNYLKYVEGVQIKLTDAYQYKEAIRRNQEFSFNCSGKDNLLEMLLEANLLRNIETPFSYIEKGVGWKSKDTTIEWSSGKAYLTKYLNDCIQDNLDDKLRSYTKTKTIYEFVKDMDIKDKRRDSWGDKRFDGKLDRKVGLKSQTQYDELNYEMETHNELSINISLEHLCYEIGQEAWELIFNIPYENVKKGLEFNMKLYLYDNESKDINFKTNKLRLRHLNYDNKVSDYHLSRGSIIWKRNKNGEKVVQNVKYCSSAFTDSYRDVGFNTFVIYKRERDFYIAQKYETKIKETNNRAVAMSALHKEAEGTAGIVAESVKTIDEDDYGKLSHMFRTPDRVSRYTWGQVVEVTFDDGSFMWYDNERMKDGKDINECYVGGHWSGYVPPTKLDSNEFQQLVAKTLAE